MSRFHLALFASDLTGKKPKLSILVCTECKANKRIGEVPVLRLRVWLYQDDNYLDGDTISKVTSANLQKKLNVVIVVGTTLKVPRAKKLVKDMYRRVR